jgi:hypothetical protein
MTRSPACYQKRDDYDKADCHGHRGRNPKVFDLDGEALAVAMEELHNRVKAQEPDPEVATKMLTESFLAALRRSNEKELREFARMKFESFSVVGRKPQ